MNDLLFCQYTKEAFYFKTFQIKGLYIYIIQDRWAVIIFKLFLQVRLVPTIDVKKKKNHPYPYKDSRLCRTLRELNSQQKYRCYNLLNRFCYKKKIEEKTI